MRIGRRHVRRFEVIPIALALAFFAGAGMMGRPSAPAGSRDTVTTPPPRAAVTPPLLPPSRPAPAAAQPPRPATRIVPAVPPPVAKARIRPAMPPPEHAKNWITVTAPAAPSNAQPSSHADDTPARALQQAMRDFGIYQGAITGNLDTPTVNAMRTVASLAGERNSPKIPEPALTRLYIDTLQNHAYGMLYAVDRFPFAGEAPSWLLAVLQDSDLDAIAARLTRAFDTGRTGAFPIMPSRNRVSALAMVRSDPSGISRCRGYRIAFTMDALNFAVTARACRGRMDGAWYVARN